MTQRKKMPLSRDVEDAEKRVVYGISLENGGMKTGDVARYLGYAQACSWTRARNHYMAQRGLSVLPKKILAPKSVECMPVSGRIARLLGISESDLSDIVDLMESCQITKGDK